MGDLEKQLAVGAPLEGKQPQSDAGDDSPNQSQRRLTIRREDVGPAPNDHSSTSASSGPARGHGQASKSDLEARKLYDLVDDIRTENPPAEAWFLEMSDMRRMHFLHINKRLAACKKDIEEQKSVKDEDVEKIRALFHEQGSYS
jgi:hypothetical protein